MPPTPSRVLLAIRDAQRRMLWRVVLTAERHEVAELPRGDDVASTAPHPDVVVLDLDGAAEHDWAGLARVVADVPTAAVIVVADEPGDAEPATAARALATGAAGYLVGPSSPRAMIAAVEDALTTAPPDRPGRDLGEATRLLEP